jgi:L-iditol 2-dehydrogenase
MSTMRAAHLVRPGTVELREVPVPVPGAGEIVLRVETALTCGTDLKTIRRGHPHIRLPAPLGHEASGIVAAAGAGVTRVREGDAIACVPTAPCLECELCRRGRENLCAGAAGRINLGAFADYLRIPAHIVRSHVFERPATMSPAVAAALEPLACCVHGAARVPWHAGACVAFLGDGPIALLFLQLARLRGADRILVLGRHAERLAIARAVGAHETVDVSHADPLDSVRGRTAGAGADIVVECVGRPETWRLAQELAAPGGTVLLFGGLAEGSEASFDAYRLHYQEIDLIGAYHYGRRDVHEALSLLSAGSVRIEPLITHHRPLGAIHDALDLAMSGRAVKVAIEPESP